MRIQKKFHVTDARDRAKSVEIVLDFEVVEPGPTNHARQVWPLVEEWRQLPTGVHRDFAAGRIVNFAVGLAGALDRANQLLADPNTPRRQVGTPPYGPRYCQALTAYQNSPEGGEDQKRALGFLLQFGLAACQAIDAFNAANAQARPPASETDIR